MHRLENVVALACTKFADEGIMEEKFPEAKVIRIGEIVDELRKKVANLEVQLKPSTPPKVLEERRKAAIEATKTIEEADSLCAKAIDQVS